MLPTPLRSAPPGFAEASAALTTLDEVLLGGLGRLADSQKDALRALARAFDGSPLGPLVTESVNAACSGPPQEAAMIGLAAAREALQGASADALAAQLNTLLGRPAQDAPSTSTVDAPAEALGLLSNARQWLVELGLAGLGQIEPGAVTAFDASLGELQLVSPAVLRPATLLTGFHQELLSKLPLAALTDAPRARWADLWSRALLACLPKQPRPTAEAVEGAKLSPFMVEAQHHRNMVSAVIWGVLDQGGKQRVVRATLSGWRVDALAGEESWWAVLRGFESALREIGERRALTVSGSLCASGDLILTKAAPGQPLDVANVAAAAMALTVWPQAAPTDRHPVQLAAPVFINSAPTRDEGVLSVPLGDGQVPITLDRLSPLQGLDAVTVAKSDRLWGLLRFDGGAWSFQPLAVQAKGAKTPSGPWEGIAAAAKTKSSTLANLSERAAKLLRKKS